MVYLAVFTTKEVYNLVYNLAVFTTKEVCNLVYNLAVFTTKEVYLPCRYGGTKAPPRRLCGALLVGFWTGFW